MARQACLLDRKLAYFGRGEEQTGAAIDRLRLFAVCRASGPLVEWMADSLGIQLSVVEEFKYPGHSQLCMHAPQSRSGLDLIKQLRQAVQKRENIYLMLQSPVTRPITDERREVVGVEAETPDGKMTIGVKKVILACNGFGGNKGLLHHG